MMRVPSIARQNGGPFDLMPHRHPSPWMVTLHFCTFAQELRSDLHLCTVSLYPRLRLALSLRASGQPSLSFGSPANRPTDQPINSCRPLYPKCLLPPPLPVSCSPIGLEVGAGRRKYLQGGASAPLIFFRGPEALIAPQQSLSARPGEEVIGQMAERRTPELPFPVPVT
jgi:hypothetical protein